MRWPVAALMLAGCRGVLGIDDLGDSNDEVGPSESVAGGQAGRAGAGGFVPVGGAAGKGSGGGTQIDTGGGQAGAGTAGAGGTGTAGTPGASGAGGKAGAGTAGKAGAGGTIGGGGSGQGGPGPDPVKACQQQCKDAAPEGQVKKYYELVGGCSCQAGALPSCQPLCGSCALTPGTFDGESAACVSCIADKFDSNDCGDEADGCKGPCASFAACLAGCGP